MAAVAEQVVVGAAFYDAAGIEDQHFVGGADRGQAVGDHERRAAGQELPQGLLD